MAGPWEKYAQPQEQQSGPWAKYATNQPEQPAELPVAEADQAPSQMPYGEQMRKAFSAMGRGADGFMRGAANGLSFGMADRLAAAMGDKPYEQALKDERQKTADAPLSGAGNVAGMIGGGVGLAKSGVTLAGRVGEGLLPRVLGYGAEGAAYGAAQEAGNNDGTPSDKLNAAKHGAMVGGGIGASLPIAGSLMGKGYQIASALMAKPVDGANRSANALLRLSTTQDDLARFDALGPNAMLADASPTMLGLAQGAATKPGSAKDQISKALTARNEGTEQRIAGSIKENLGPVVSPDRFENAMENVRTNKIGPKYQEIWANAPKIAVNGVDRALMTHAENEAGPALSVYNKARELLKTGPEFKAYPYENLNSAPNPMVADQAPVARLPFMQPAERLHNIKEAVAADAGAYERLGSSAANSANRAGTISTKEINTALENNVPGYHDANRYFESMQGRKEAFDSGRRALNNPEVFPEDLAKNLAEMDKKGRSSAILGNRAQIASALGNNQNDLKALGQMVGGSNDFNRAKMGLLHGEDATKALANTVENERLFRSTHDNVLRNSQTAQRSAANAQIEGTELALPEGGGLGGLGIRLANKGLAAISGRSNDATRQALADMLTRSGPEGRKVIEDVLSSKNNADQIAEMLRNFASKPGGLNSRVGAFLPDNREQRRK